MKFHQTPKNAITILFILVLSFLLMGKALALGSISDKNGKPISHNRKTLANAEFCATFDDGNLVFRGEGSDNQQGIYIYWNGYLTTIANQNTSVPEGTEKFTKFGLCPAFDENNVVFLAEDSKQEQGIYISIDGFLSTVANRKTRIPNGKGTFMGFGSCLGIDDKDVVFLGDGSENQQGIYIYTGGLLSTVVDRNTPIPGGEGNFVGFGSCAAIDHENVIFLGYGNYNQQGIYSFINDSLFAIADFDTPIPRGKGTFTSFDSVLVNDHANISFPNSSIQSDYQSD